MRNELISKPDGVEETVRRNSLVVLLMCVGLPGSAVAQVSRAPTAEERAGIERLHQQDIAATIANDSKLLCALWSADAVRLEPGGEADVGRRVICAKDAREIASHPSTKITYDPQIHDVQVIGDVAYEWVTFDASSKGPNDTKPRMLRGKALRILRRQPDGSWRFSRVMWNVSQ